MAIIHCLVSITPGFLSVNMHMCMAFIMNLDVCIKVKSEHSFYIFRFISQVGMSISHDANK